MTMNTSCLKTNKCQREKRTRVKTTSARLSGIVDVDQRSIQGNDDSNDANERRKKTINGRMLMRRRTENVERKLSEMHRDGGRERNGEDKRRRRRTRRTTFFQHTIGLVRARIAMNVECGASRDDARRANHE